MPSVRSEAVEAGTVSSYAWLGVAILLAVGGCWLASWFDRGNRVYADPFTRTRDEIRSLPETSDGPYDWSATCDFLEEDAA